jgi:erythromycin esterase
LLAFLVVDPLLSSIRSRARALSAPAGLEGLVEKLARHRIVLLGEATHGTHEFYKLRAEITLRLLRDHGFGFVAVEGDWPACQELDRYVQQGTRAEARALRFAPLTVESGMRKFDRWPTWMWANREIAAFSRELRQLNATRPAGARAGFHGLDVYSLFESVDEALRLVESVNPILARRCRLRYECFQPFQGDERRYARSLLKDPSGCRDQSLAVLGDILKSKAGFRPGSDPEEALFDAAQNARVVVSAEKYYRTLTQADDLSWNVRDQHMLETLAALLERGGSACKAIVWAHNTHIGDHRATDMERMGMVNLGGLARMRWSGEVAAVGFGTHSGELIASRAWEGRTETLPLPASRPDSIDHALHEAGALLGAESYWLWLDSAARQGELAVHRPQRAVGVVYDPDHEKGNYVSSSLARRYDAFVFVDRTHALEPLVTSHLREELPSTWPAGY